MQRKSPVTVHAKCWHEHFRARAILSLLSVGSWGAGTTFLSAVTNAYEKDN